jgi:hypothetical protein
MEKSTRKGEWNKAIRPAAASAGYQQSAARRMQLAYLSLSISCALVDIGIFD